MDLSGICKWGHIRNNMHSDPCQKTPIYRACQSIIRRYIDRAAKECGWRCINVGTSGHTWQARKYECSLRMNFVQQPWKVILLHLPLPRNSVGSREGRKQEIPLGETRVEVISCRLGEGGRRLEKLQLGRCQLWMQTAMAQKPSLCKKHSTNFGVKDSTRQRVGGV